MTLDSFTLNSALIGGAIIGLSACFMMLFFGRITGISSIIWNTASASKSHFSSNGLFLCGLILGTTCITYISGIEIRPIESNAFMIILAGLLVGYGTKLGSGCTSGHGICGISLFSIRSIIATLLFMASGIATVYVMRHVL
jgi:uncharacterized membrane protein YedE/YeeE